MDISGSTHTEVVIFQCLGIREIGTGVSLTQHDQDPVQTVISVLPPLQLCLCTCLWGVGVGPWSFSLMCEVECTMVRGMNHSCCPISCLYKCPISCLHSTGNRVKAVQMPNLMSCHTPLETEFSCHNITPHQDSKNSPRIAFEVIGSEQKTHRSMAQVSS